MSGNDNLTVAEVPFVSDSEPSFKSSSTLLKGPPLLPKKRSISTLESEGREAIDAVDLEDGGPPSTSSGGGKLSSQLDDYRVTLDAVERTCKRLKTEINRVVAMVAASASSETCSLSPANEEEEVEDSEEMVPFSRAEAFVSDLGEEKSGGDNFHGFYAARDKEYYNNEELDEEEKENEERTYPSSSNIDIFHQKPHFFRNESFDPSPVSYPSSGGLHRPQSLHSSGNHQPYSPTDSYYCCEPLDLSVTGQSYQQTNLHSNINNNNNFDDGHLNLPDSPNTARRPSDDTLERFMKVDPSQNVKWRELAERFGKELAPNICGICGKTLSCKSALTMHYRVHTEERPFVCSICDKRFSTKGNLKTHLGQHGDAIDAVRTPNIFMTTSTPMMSSSGDLPIRSIEEPIPFYMESSSLHDVDNVHQCPLEIGQKLFSTKKATDEMISEKEIGEAEHEEVEEPINLQQTREEEICVHTDQSLFLESCESKIDSGDSGIVMATSCMSDTGSPDTNTSSGRRKEYNCETCSKAFPTRSALQIHTRSHTGEKPFHCADCRKPFSTQGNMKTHREKHCPCRRSSQPSLQQQQQQQQQTSAECLVPNPLPPRPPAVNWPHPLAFSSNPFWHHVVRPNLPMISSNFRSLLSFPGDMKAPLSMSPWLALSSGAGPITHQLDVPQITEIREDGDPEVGK